ncbi:MAG: hypothetical protein ABSA76_07500 [Bacteroidales bacterium]
MEQKDIIIVAIVCACVGFSLYRRFLKKKGNTKISGKDSRSTSAFSSSSKDDDYEPYSKK